MSTWHSLRNLPRNLRSIKPYVHFHLDNYKWFLSPLIAIVGGLFLSEWLFLMLVIPEAWLDLAPLHDTTDPYPVAHFDAAGLNLRFGPFVFEAGLRDSD